MNDPRGSIWRKWDFHIHTPASFNWRGTKNLRDLQNGEEKNRVLAEIVQALNDADAEAFAVMDYWTFEGFKELRRFIAANPNLSFHKALFPGMELRCEAQEAKRLNVHVLLSDELTDEQLNEFHAKLRLLVVDRPPSYEALCETATKLTPPQLRKAGGSSPLSEAEQYRIGCETAVIHSQSLIDALKALPDGMGWLFVPFTTYGGVRDVLPPFGFPLYSRLFLTEGHLFETRDPHVAACLCGVRTRENAHYFNDLIEALGGSAKPAICGSDAHRPSDYGVFTVSSDGEAMRCWVKADPTVAGIRQILQEPAARTFIGLEPEKFHAVRTHPTKHIASIDIRKKQGSTLSQKWFDASIPINPELVAIVGNKGSGKSALADIIALLGNSHCEDNDFSFLTEGKFRRKRENLAQHFVATLIWKSGQCVTKGLDDRADRRKPEQVKYIPQLYLERICSEVASGENSHFSKELKAVIFSHVPLADRLKKASLDELLEYKAEETRRTIAIHYQELQEVNRSIIRFQTLLTGDYKVMLESRLTEKNRELKAHDDARPVEIPEPRAEDPKRREAIEKINVQIESLRGLLVEITGAVAATEEELREIALKRAGLAKLLEQLDNLQLQFDTFMGRSANEFARLGIDVASVVSFNIDKSALTLLDAQLSGRELELRHQLTSDTIDGFISRRKTAEAELAALQKELDGPEREYEAFLSARQKWETIRNGIIGTEQAEGTIKYLEAMIADLAQVPSRLRSAETRREEITRTIFSKIHALSEEYRNLYGPVQQFITEQEITGDGMNLAFEVTISPAGFVESFFEQISQGAAGTFYGVDRGQAYLKSIITAHDFSSADDVVSFLGKIMDCLRFDRRQPSDTPASIVSQLKKEHSEEALLDYLFGLSYLSPRYALRLGEKDIQQLSPGERGILLLMFYLIVDKDDCPLIIDQPEDNLDNQTVFSTLGRCIREAKKRRQIIIVTHNPNLAVACDAEQIICASHDTTSGNTVNYTSGAIENPKINRRLVDILEGTKPAFQNREAKYFETLTLGGHRFREAEHTDELVGGALK